MMQDAHLKFQDCHSKSCIQQAEDSFSQIGSKFQEETSKCCILSTELYGANTWTWGE